MSKLLDKMKQVKFDKLLHFFYGSIIFHLMLLVFTEPWAIYFLIVIAFGKELYDDFCTKDGRFDIYDILYTILPAILF